jgi:hypothetical protein
MMRQRCSSSSFGDGRPCFQASDQITAFTDFNKVQNVVFPRPHSNSSWSRDGVGLWIYIMIMHRGLMPGFLCQEHVLFSEVTRQGSAMIRTGDRGVFMIGYEACYVIRRHTRGTSARVA